jgi:S1-C subfamily serine protease
VLVETVVPNSPAADGPPRRHHQLTIAGMPYMLGGDVITAVDGNQSSVH